MIESIFSPLDYLNLVSVFTNKFIYKYNCISKDLLGDELLVTYYARLMLTGYRQLADHLKLITYCLL